MNSRIQELQKKIDNADAAYYTTGHILTRSAWFMGAPPAVAPTGPERFRGCQILLSAGQCPDAPRAPQNRPEGFSFPAVFLNSPHGEEI
jgi:hypothetical protein